MLESMESGVLVICLETRSGPWLQFVGWNMVEDLGFED